MDIKRNCTINTNLEDWDHLQIEMNGASIFNIDSNLTINNNTNISHTQILMDRDAKITVGNNFAINQSSKGDIQIEMNNNNNGDADTDATKITTGNDFNITADSIRNFAMDIRDYAKITTGGDFDISIDSYSTSWGDFSMALSANSAINVNDDFTIDNNGSSGTNLIITMENYSEINTGSSGSNSDFSITQNGEDELKLLMKHNTGLNIYGDFIFNKKNSNGVDATIVLNTNAQITVYKHLILKNDNNSDLVYLDLENDNTVLNVRGDIDMTSAVAASRILIQAKEASNIYLGGSILRNNSPNRFGSLNFSATGTIHYNGDGTYGQQIIAENEGNGGDSIIYQNININNTWSTVPQLTMEGIVNLYSGRNLKFTNGIVSSSDTKYFSIYDNATVSDASDSSYNDGIIYKTGNDAFTFPVGGTDVFGNSHYAGIGISAPADTSSVFTARYYASGHSSATTYESPLTKVSLVEYWDLERAIGSDNIDLTLYWGNGTRSGIGDISDLRLSHWDGAIWQNLGSSSTTGTASSGSITVTGVSNFSPFTFGTVNNVNNPLPVEIISFTAKENNGIINLNWVTASELNSRSFTIERSIDGKKYCELNTINGAGNSNTSQYYNYKDLSPFNGISYYRIKQTDFNGSYKYSEIRAINLVKDSNLDFIVYPNPVSKFDIINIALNNKENHINLKIFDANGKLIHNEDFAQTNNIKLKNSSLIPGMYLIQLNINGKQLHKKIIIK